MTANDDRRRISAALRAVPNDAEWEEDVCEDLDCLIAVSVFGEDFCISNCKKCLERSLNHIAGLINGDMLQVTYSRSTCGPDGKAYMVKVRHRAKGWERDFYAVDRDALLALADELETDGVDCYGVSTQYVLDEYARRIREALGAS